MSLVFPEAEITGHVGGTGLSSRKPVRAATVTNGTFATGFADGQTVDGVILAAGDRVLLKNQITTLQNGVYDVQVSGAPIRSTDFDDGNAVASTFVYVQSGTVNGSTGWLCTNTSGQDIVSTNALSFKLISGDTSGNGTSTDNAIMRWDGTTGTKIQDSAIIIDDSNNMTGLQYLQFSDIKAPINPLAGQGRLYKKNGSAGIFWKPDAAGAEIDLTAATSTSFQTSLAGLSPSTAQTGTVILSGILGATSGGTGSSTAPTAGQMLVGTSGGSYVPFTVTSGTGISTTTGSGTFQINNTGVTSLLGTTNQVSVSASTGAVTISTPSTFIAPGTIQDSTGMLYSTSATVSAAGTTQGTATLLTTSYNVVTTVAANTGVRLLSPTAGYIINIVNKGANALNIYPATGGVIDSAGLNTAIVLLIGATITLQASSTTQWYTVSPPIAPGAGMKVTYDNGRTTVTAIGEDTSPLTTKGDIWVYSSFNTRLPVGADGYILSSNSAQATGLQWIQAFTPAQLPFAVVTDTIAADTNNYNPAGLSTAVQLRLTATGAVRSITGLVISGSAGAPNNNELKITNVGTFNIILRNESALSTAANRFTFDGKDMVVLPGQNLTVWYDWTTSRWRGVASSVDGKLGGQFSTPGVISPASISSDQDDYAPAGIENASIIRVNANSVVNLNGLTGGYDGRRIVLVNIGSQPITLVNQAGTSLAANRIFTGTSNTTIVGNNSASLIYDGTSGFWRVFAGTGGAITGTGGLIQSQWVEVNTDLTTPETDWKLYWGSINAAVTLPTGTITVVNTAARSPPALNPGSAAANAASVANPQTLYVQTNANGIQRITYTGTNSPTNTQFTGCTGGIGTLSVGNNVWGGPVQTSITAGSNGVNLPTGTINVVSTTGFPASGTLLVTTGNGTQRVLYAGTTATTFTGCTLGTGTMSTGGLIYNVTPNSPQDFMTINLTTSGGALIIIMTANASTASNKTGYFQVVVDGVFRRGGSVQGNGGAPAGSVVVSLKISNIPAGDHVVAARWVVSSSANLDIKPVTKSNDNNASLLVQEVST